MFIHTHIHISGGSRGMGCCKKRIRGARGGQGAIMTRIPNSNHTGSSGTGTDVVLIPGNFQVYPEL